MTQFIIDTSVWSEALRRKKNIVNSSETIIRKIIENDDEIVVLGIIFQEILTGISNEKLFKEIKDVLDDFVYLEITKNDYIYASELSNKCRSKGIIAGSVDFLIASTAIRNELQLVTFDKDFFNISKHTDLKILEIDRFPGNKN
ncbi:MAG: VapC toxin family PIN domain ribonuclease [Spirochaetae bacterium HGW-Spirochaetae-5]|nr:MAG: VapC toxin family PIN domain ribonuclease [Spirochaetae bacterium HGW-Spirochaetae-5]